MIQMPGAAAALGDHGPVAPEATSDNVDATGDLDKGVRTSPARSR
jgi:hypothetical protein